MPKLLLRTALFLLILSTSAAVPAYPDSNPTPSAGVLEMTLADAVSLALRQNRSIRIYYLDRVLEKYNLEYAESEFIPNVRLDGSANIQRDTEETFFHKLKDTDLKRDTWSAGAQTSVSQKIPTGGEFAFVWDNSRDFTRTDDGLLVTNDQGFTSSWTASFRQPLLKGGGTTINRASLVRARLKERENILALRDNLSNVIASAITGYLQFYQSTRNVRIRKTALERAREQFEINKVLVESGRMAPSELVQSEAQVADQEFAYESALNNLDNARLNLLDVLELNLETEIRPVEDINLKMVKPDLEKTVAVARANNTSLLVAENSVTRAELELIEEKNSRLWELDAQASYGREFFDSFGSNINDHDKDFWSIGFSLNAPIEIFGRDYLEEKIPLIQARRDVHVSKINLKEEENDLKTRVINGVRNVHSQLRLVQQARKKLELARQKLEIEKVKLRLGRTTNFQVVSFENDLVNAQESELQSTISYLNALTDLDLLLGTVLDTWDVEFKTQSSRAQETLGSEGYFYGREP
ncbi:MAG: TolC family protein [Desulfovibrionales bacterium]